MSSRHLVDHELLPILDAAPSFALNAATLPAVRSRKYAPPLPPIVPNDVARRDLHVPGPAGAPPVGLVTYTPLGTGPFPCIYHMHGGGFVTGSPYILEFMHRPLAQTLRCVVASVDYRLAPETVFPGAIEDCYAGLAWISANADELNIDRARIGVMGESAGGGLAAALALLARDRGDHAVAFQVLTYPMLDDRTGTDEPLPYAGEFLWTLERNRFGWSSLLGHAPGQAKVSPYAAPSRAENLAGLPPSFLMCGALDLFAAETIDYARGLIGAGVPTDLRIYPGAFHDFDSSPTAQVARQARRDRLEALDRLLQA